LFWGIIGALVMRGIFIAVGVGLIRRFHWVIYAFGAFLIYSGIQMMVSKDKGIHPERNPVLRLFRRSFNVTEDYVGGKMLAEDYWRIPTYIALTVIGAILAITILLSLVFPEKENQAAA